MLIAFLTNRYDAWLKTASLHPAPAGAASGLPHAIDFAAVWKAWEQQVNDAARPHASKVPPHEFVDKEYADCMLIAC